MKPDIADVFHFTEEYPIAQLQDDCKLLESLLDDCLRMEIGEAQFHNVELLRSLAKSATDLAHENDHESANFLSEKLVRLIQSMPLTQSLPIARACGHYLNLTGIAEMHHKVRQHRTEGQDGFQSFDQVFMKLLAKGISKEEIFKAVCQQSLEVVFTAHPTQIVRRTLQYKFAKIAALLETNDRPDLTPHEKEEVIEDLMREVSALWYTQEIRAKKPTPTDEARGGLHIVERSLWTAIPSYFRRLSAALKKATGFELPVSARSISFGSWMGGDKEGNPNMTAEITRQIAYLSQWIAADLYLREVDALRFELSMSKCNDRVWKMVKRIVAKNEIDIQDRGWEGDHDLSNFSMDDVTASAIAGIEMPEVQDSMPSVPREVPSILSLARKSLNTDRVIDKKESSKADQLPTPQSSMSLSSDQDPRSSTPKAAQQVKQATFKKTSTYASSTKLDELLNPLQGSYSHEGSHPYRLVLGEVHQKLANTKKRVEMLLAGIHVEDDTLGDYYQSSEELLDIIYVIYESLRDCGVGIIANGRILDLIRRLNCFGMCLMKMDIRQESFRQVDAIDEILQYLELGSYRQWEESKRLEFLTEELQSNRPLISMDMPISDQTKEVLETFLVSSELGPNSLGAFVVCKPSAASDVLLVHLFQREAALILAAKRGGVPNFKQVLNVVPSFETLDGLSTARHMLESLVSNPWYGKYLKEAQNSRQEVMLGFCDSGKDACRLSSAWALYQCQEQLVELFGRLDVELTLFHGRGGAMGRGGGAPMWLAIQSQPPGAINGSLRLTEQGEMIQTKFGIPAVAEGQLEVCSTGMLLATLVQFSAPRDETWLELMNQLSADSCEAYRSVIFDSKFDDYFKHVTPDSELAIINPDHEQESIIRPIPWIFSWTQTRQVLPSWLGLGDALQRVIDDGDLTVLQRMYQDWPFFQSTLDLIEMVLAKVDTRISATYENLLITDPEEKALGDKIKESYKLTVECVLMVTGHSRLCEHNTLLRHLLLMRKPFLDPINILQSQILIALRKSPMDKKLNDALLITVNGIAAGMRNTG